MAVPFIASSMVLFALGGLVAYITLPKGLNFLLGFAGGLHAAHHRQLVHRVRGAAHARVRAVVRVPDPADLPGHGGRRLQREAAAWRRPAIVLIAVFAAVITPSSDPYTMLAMMIPMYLFYEAAIIVIRLLKK